MVFCTPSVVAGLFLAVLYCFIKCHHNLFSFVNHFKYLFPVEGPISGVPYTIRFVIDEQGLNDAIGLELVTVKTNKEGEDSIGAIRPFKVVNREGNLYTFECDIQSAHAGSFKAAVRMFPKNDKLPHRQDFAYVKWLEY